MKLLTLLSALFCCIIARAQNTAQTSIEAQLYLPAHIKNTIAPNDKLIVYYVRQDSVGNNETAKLNVRKVKDNIYSFSLKHSFYFRLVFVIGEYSYNMQCVDNLKGTVADDYHFNIMLQKQKFDVANLQYIMPCLN